MYPPKNRGPDESDPLKIYCIKILLLRFAQRQNDGDSRSDIGKENSNQQGSNPLKVAVDSILDIRKTAVQVVQSAIDAIQSVVNLFNDRFQKMCPFCVIGSEWEVREDPITAEIVALCAGAFHQQEETPVYLREKVVTHCAEPRPARPPGIPSRLWPRVRHGLRFLERELGVLIEILRGTLHERSRQCVYLESQIE